MEFQKKRGVIFVSSVISQDRINFQEEQNQLLQVILNERFFKPWARGCESGPDVPPGALELFLTSTCNQRCEYCYLVKHPELYPQEYNNKTLIMENLAKVYDWIIKNNWRIPQIEFYTGEIWHTSWGLEVFELTLEYLYKGLSVGEFLIPTNGSFARDREQMDKILRYVRKFQDLNVRVQFSFSVDGAIIENMERPLVSGEEKTEDFYDTLFLLCKEYGFAFHPMLAAKSAKYWIENYKWWKRKLHEYNLPMHSLMILEVRNNDWEDEDIEALGVFIDYMIQDTLKYYDGNVGQAAEDLFLINQCYIKDTESLWGEEMPYLPFNVAPTKGYHGCTVATSMTLRLGDLAICPCHRTAYNKNLYGWLTLDEEGQINGIKANNPQQAVKILMLDTRISNLNCDTCIYRQVCLGGCLGQQMEANKDPFRYDENVCKMLKAKYRYALNSFKKYGIFQWMKENITPYHVWYPELEVLVKLEEDIEKEKKNERLAKLRQDFYR